MNNRATHTYTWLKIFVPAFALELLVLWMMSYDLSLRLPAVVFALGISISGLIIGLLMNFLSKFKGPVMVYIIGHALAVALTIGAGSFYFDGSMIYSDDRIDHTTTEAAVIEDTTNYITGNDKRAIEKVLYLMEQLYPLGAYELVDVLTEYRRPDSSEVYCTVFFKVTEEGNKVYVSQYTVRNDLVEPIYTKLDTSSEVYKAYERDSTAR